MPETMLPRSPLDLLAAPGRYGALDREPGITIAVRAPSIASLIARRSRADALRDAVARAFGAPLPTTPRRVAGRDIAFIWAGPERWLALAGDGLRRDLEGELRERLAGLAAVADQSDGQVLLRVAGRKARDALAKGLPIDLHPRAFGPDDVALTAVAHIGVHLWQVDGAPTYEIAAPRSFAGSFWRWLMAAAAEYGCEVRGERD